MLFRSYIVQFLPFTSRLCIKRRLLSMDNIVEKVVWFGGMQRGTASTVPECCQMAYKIQWRQANRGRLLFRNLEGALLD